MANRRDFLKKLGVGSLILTGTGLFKVEQATTKKDLVLKQATKEDLLELANSILNVCDGKSGGKYDEIAKQALNANLETDKYVYKFS